jgi:hypothetical protein
MLLTSPAQTPAATEPFPLGWQPSRRQKTTAEIAPITFNTHSPSPGSVQAALSEALGHQTFHFAAAFACPSTPDQR